MFQKLVLPIFILFQNNIFSGGPDAAAAQKEDAPRTPRPCKSSTEGICEVFSRQLDIAWRGQKWRFCSEVNNGHYEKYFIEDIDLEHRAERALEEALDRCKGGPDVLSICTILGFLRSGGHTVNPRYLQQCRPILARHAEVCSDLSHYCTSVSINSIRYGMHELPAFGLHGGSYVA